MNTFEAEAVIYRDIWVSNMAAQVVVKLLANGIRSAAFIENCAAIG